MQKKRRRRVRKPTAADLENLPAAAGAGGESADHGARDASTKLARDQMETETEKQKRKEGWAKAVEKAKDQASMFGASSDLHP